MVKTEEFVSRRKKSGSRKSPRAFFSARGLVDGEASNIKSPRHVPDNKDGNKSMIRYERKSKERTKSKHESPTNSRDMEHSDGSFLTQNSDDESTVHSSEDDFSLNENPAEDLMRDVLGGMGCMSVPMFSKGAKQRDPMIKFNKEGERTTAVEFNMKLPVPDMGIMNQLERTEMEFKSKIDQMTCDGPSAMHAGSTKRIDYSVPFQVIEDRMRPNQAIAPAFHGLPTHSTEHFGHQNPNMHPNSHAFHNPHMYQNPLGFQNPHSHAYQNQHGYPVGGQYVQHGGFARVHSPRHGNMAYESAPFNREIYVPETHPQQIFISEQPCLSEDLIAVDDMPPPGQKFDLTRYHPKPMNRPPTYDIGKPMLSLDSEDSEDSDEDDHPQVGKAEGAEKSQAIMQVRSPRNRQPLKATKDGPEETDEPPSLSSAPKYAASATTKNTNFQGDSKATSISSPRKRPQEAPKPMEHDKYQPHASATSPRYGRRNAGSSANQLERASPRESPVVVNVTSKSTSANSTDTAIPSFDESGPSFDGPTALSETVEESEPSFDQHDAKGRDCGKVGYMFDRPMRVQGKARGLDRFDAKKEDLDAGPSFDGQARNSNIPDNDGPSFDQLDVIRSGGSGHFVDGSEVFGTSIEESEPSFDGPKISHASLPSNDDGPSFDGPSFDSDEKKTKHESVPSFDESFGESSNTSTVATDEAISNERPKTKQNNTPKEKDLDSGLRVESRVSETPSMTANDENAGDLAESPSMDAPFDVGNGANSTPKNSLSRNKGRRFMRADLRAEELDRKPLNLRVSTNLPLSPKTEEFYSPKYSASNRISSVKSSSNRFAFGETFDDDEFFDAAMT